MSIFTEEHLSDVQEVIKKSNGHSNGSHNVSENPSEISELNKQSQRIQELLEELESYPDGKAREMIQECVQEILSFYGNGLKRILDIISKGNSSASKDIYNNLIDDSFVSGLLLIHDLHPLDLNTRLHIALEKVKPYMDSHGGSVEIISLENGIAKLKLSGHCKGCPSSASTLELGIKKEIEENCPDLLGLEVEGLVAPAVHSENGKASSQSSGGWKEIDNVSLLKNGTMKVVEVSGKSLLILRVNSKLYAYRNECPACGVLLNNGNLEGAEIRCNLGHRYDVHLAGKCTDDPEIHLEPFPLLEVNGTVKVNVGG